MNLQAPRLPLSRGADPECLRGDPAAAGQRLPLQGPIPPIRGKCPEGTKGVGMLARSA